MKGHFAGDPEGSGTRELREAEGGDHFAQAFEAQPGTLL